MAGIVLHFGDQIGLDAQAAVGERAHRPRVISIGVTSDVPSASEAFGSSGEVMPRRCAASTTLEMPTSCASEAVMVLTECASACASVIVP